MVVLLKVHPSRRHDLREPDRMRVEPECRSRSIEDLFGNLSTRFVAPPGSIRLTNSTLIEDSGAAGSGPAGAREVPIGGAAARTLRYLMGSRFCEVDLLSTDAVELFGNAPGDGGGCRRSAIGCIRR